MPRSATNLVDTDARRDRDRRCFKEAKDMPTLFREEQIWKDTGLSLLKADPMISADLFRSIKTNCAVRQNCCVVADKLCTDVP